MRKRWFKALALGLPLIFSAAPFVGTKANAHEVTKNDLVVRGLTQPMVDMFIPLAGNMFSFTPNQIATTDVGAFFMLLLGQMRYFMEASIAPLELKLEGVTANPITAAQMRRMMSGQEVQIVDIRSKAEFDGVHIPGSINVPLDEYDEFVKSGKLDPDKPEILICACGIRALTAGYHTVTYGYDNVYYLNSGIGEWIGAGMPLSLQGTEVTKTQASAVYQKGRIVADSEDTFGYQSAPSLAEAYPDLDLVFKKSAKIVNTKDQALAEQPLNTFLGVQDRAAGINRAIGMEQPGSENWVEAPNFGPTLIGTVNAMLDYANYGWMQGEYMHSWIASQLYEKWREDPNLTVVDVRSALEYNGMHIAKIQFHELGEDVEQFLDSGELDKNAPICFVCANGPRGAQAAMMAIEKGFTQVYDLIGGTTNWTAAGFPVVY